MSSPVPRVREPAAHAAGLSAAGAADAGDECAPLARMLPTAASATSAIPAPIPREAPVTIATFP